MMISSCRRVLAPAMLVAAGLSLGGCGNFAGEGLETAENTAKKTVSAEEKDCLVRAMYFEANRSSDDGLLAVGSVVMNRVESGQYPGTICGTVGQPRQFASGVLTRKMAERDKPRVERVAETIIDGARHPKLDRAMFFHVATRRYSYPNMKYVLVAGGNIFYERGSRKFTTVASVGESVQRAQSFSQKPLVVAMAPVESFTYTTDSYAKLIAANR
ncbi:cell wall hydrolase [Microvirga pudoricolor]|uniref:cell wall hydrolase n=1 Tax=Microvirga pudoricolor TaxID=2778729 RepID=UPI001951834C|nr:cell wall hydrolase [Microvirga pudoricolor]